MLKIESLRFQYPKTSKPCLEDVSFELRPGECTALLGQSGAGKTTLLRCIAGLYQAQSGSITLGEQTNTSLSEAVGLIFQDHALIPHRNVLWHVCCGALNTYGPIRSLGWWRQSDIDRALKCIELVGLADKALERIQHLSGGQRQRVAIARVLMHQPQVFLADEPIASLDPGVASDILQLIKSQLNDQRYCLISLHQTSAARRYADRIIAIDKGSIVYDGPSTDFSVKQESQLYQQELTA